MVKYLVRRDNHFWYRRKIKGYGEVVFSLQTKNHNIALVRHAYIDFQIKKLMYKGAFELMTVQEIRKLIDKYKIYMIEEEYNNFEDIRDKELTVNIEGKTYGGHTREALGYAINRYKAIHEQNNLELVKEETAKILKRSNFTSEDLAQLKTDKDNKIFHWELIKAEWELLHRAYEEQKEVVQKTDKEEPSISPEIITAYANFAMSQKPIKKSNAMSITELLQKYITENQEAKDWSDKNGRDLEYVLGHLASYYNDKDISELTRENFSQFRDNVIRNLPKTSQNKIFIGKSTIEVIRLVKNKKLEKIGLSTVNKHLRRIHQVFEWGSNCGYLEKNLTKDLKLIDKKKSKKKKTVKIPYSQEDLVKLFNSPWYNEELTKTLRYKPQNIFIPILALFTGAKPVELGTLKLSSIKKKNGMWGIYFNQMFKTVDSERFTPLSQVIIDLGFLKYVQYQKKQKEKLLFPTISVYKSGGINFTNDFTQHNRKYITEEKDKTFYSIRHLVNQMLKNKKTPVYIINDILGHSDGQGNKDIEVYGDNMPEEILRDTINDCLVYDYLDFSELKKVIESIY